MVPQPFKYLGVLWNKQKEMGTNTDSQLFLVWMTVKIQKVFRMGKGKIAICVQCTPWEIKHKAKFLIIIVSHLDYPEEHQPHEPSILRY